jgi:hypothetical protein
MDSDRDLKQDTYRDAGSDERFDAADAQPGPQRESLRVTVFDARGAVLLDGPAAVRYGDDLLTVRYTDLAVTGSGVLPVRSDADPSTGKPGAPEPHPDGLAVYAYTVAHYHHHAHGTAAGDVLTHSHKHEHTGAESRRANELGHTADVHAHPH